MTSRILYLESPTTINFRMGGQVATRTIRADALWFGPTDKNPEPHWNMRGFDIDHREDRFFPMADMKDVEYV